MVIKFKMQIYDYCCKITVKFSPDGNGNFAGKNGLVFLMESATEGSAFAAIETSRFDKKLQCTAGSCC